MQHPDRSSNPAASETAKAVDIKPASIVGAEVTDYAALLGIEDTAPLAGKPKLDVEAELGMPYERKIEQIVKTAAGDTETIAQGREEYRQALEQTKGASLIEDRFGQEKNPLDRLTGYMRDHRGNLIGSFQEPVTIQDPVERHHLAEERVRRTEDAARLTARAIGQAQAAIESGDWGIAVSRATEYDLVYAGTDPGTVEGDILVAVSRYHQTGSDADRQIAAEIAGHFHLYPDQIFSPNAPSQFLKRISEAAADAIVWQKEQAAKAAQQEAARAVEVAQAARLKARDEMSFQSGRNVAGQLLQFSHDGYIDALRSGRRPNQRADNPISIFGLGLSDGAGRNAYDSVVRDLRNPDGSSLPQIYTPSDYVSRMEYVLDGLRYAEGSIAQALLTNRKQNMGRSIGDDQLRIDMEASVRAHLAGFAQTVLDRQLQVDQFVSGDSRSDVPFDRTDVALAIRAYNAASPDRIVNNQQAMEQIKTLITARPDLGAVVVEELKNADIRHSERETRLTATHEQHVIEQEAKAAKKAAAEQEERDRVAQQEAEQLRVKEHAFAEHALAEQARVTNELAVLNVQLKKTPPTRSKGFLRGKEPNPAYQDLIARRDELQTQLNALQLTEEES